MGTKAGPEVQAAPPKRRSSVSLGKLLLILAGLGLLGLLFWAGVAAIWAHFYGKKLMDDTQAVIEEGATAGRLLDAEGCLKTALEGLDTCKVYDLKCRFRQQFFLQGCLTSCRASHQYCQNVPPSTRIFESVSFRTEACSKHQQAGSQGCAQLLQTLQMFCDRVRQEPRPK